MSSAKTSCLSKVKEKEGEKRGNNKEIEGVSKLKRDCEGTAMKDWGAGSNRMRDPVPDLPENSRATTFSVGWGRVGTKNFILDLVFIQFGVALFNPTTRRDACHRLRAQFSSVQLRRSPGKGKKKAILGKQSHK